MSYYRTHVGIFALMCADHYLKFRRCVRNVIDCGTDERLGGIWRAIDLLSEPRLAGTLTLPVFRASYSARRGECDTQLPCPAPSRHIKRKHGGEQEGDTAGKTQSNRQKMLGQAETGEAEYTDGTGEDNNMHDFGEGTCSLIYTGYIRFPLLFSYM